MSETDQVLLYWANNYFNRMLYFRPVVPTCLITVQREKSTCDYFLAKGFAYITLLMVRLLAAASRWRIGFYAWGLSTGNSWEIVNTFLPRLLSSKSRLRWQTSSKMPAS